MSLKLPSSTPFPLSLKTHTLHSPHKFVHFQVQYTRRERLIIRKTQEFEKFYDLHHNKGPQELKALLKVLIEKERKNAKDGGKSLGPIEFGDILGKGRSPTISLALALSGITEKKPEEEKPEEEKPEEKKQEDKDDAEFNKWLKEALKEEKKEEEKKKKEDLALALQKSMSGEKSGEATGAGNLLGVQAFKSFVLALLLGADPNDPAVKALLPSLPDESKCNEEEESGSKGEDEKK